MLAGVLAQACRPRRGYVAGVVRPPARPAPACPNRPARGFLGEPDGMHQLEQRRHVLVGFGCELPAVLLDSFGGAEEADDGPFTFGSLVRGSLCGLAAGVRAQRECCW